jgi:hypothetical protein
MDAFSTSKSTSGVSDSIESRVLLDILKYFLIKLE